MLCTIYLVHFGLRAFLWKYLRNSIWTVIFKKLTGTRFDKEWLLVLTWADIHTLCTWIVIYPLFAIHLFFESLLWIVVKVAYELSLEIWLIHQFICLIRNNFLSFSLLYICLLRCILLRIFLLWFINFFVLKFTLAIKLGLNVLDTALGKVLTTFSVHGAAQHMHVIAS